MQSETVDGGVLETWDVGEVAQAWASNEIVIIDVRSALEYGLEHIEGAMLMPMSFFRAEKLPGQSEKRIVFHCAGGVRSEKVARAALAAGISPVAHMGGGFGAWKQAQQPYLGTDMASGAPRRMNAG